MNPMLVQLQVMCPVVYEYSISIHIHIFTIYTIYGMPNTSKPISTWQCQKKGVFYRFSTATTLRGNTFHICSIIFGMTINVPNIFPSIYFFFQILSIKFPIFQAPKLRLCLPEKKRIPGPHRKIPLGCLENAKANRPGLFQKMEKFSNKTGHWSDLEVSWNGSPAGAPSHHGFQHQNGLIEVIILQWANIAMGNFHVWYLSKHKSPFSIAMLVYRKVNH